MGAVGWMVAGKRMLAIPQSGKFILDNVKVIASSYR